MIYHLPETRMDAAALRKRASEADTGALKLNGYQDRDDSVSFSGAELADALAADGAKLTGLELRAIELGADGWREVTGALRKGACPQLTTLSLIGIKLDADALQAVLETLSSCPQLTTLILNQCDLDPAGGAALAAALNDGACPLLTKLDVSHNRVGDQAFGALAEALVRGVCPNMATLIAASNELTILPEALCGVASLRVLALHCNDIGSLPHRLLHLARLRRLAIDNNPHLAADKIMGGSLRQLNICGNPRLAAEHKAMGGQYMGHNVAALFVRLRLVHGSKPPPLDATHCWYQAEKERKEAEAEREWWAAEAEARGLADRELPTGTRIWIASHGHGEYVGFDKKTFCANDHTIRLDDGGMLTLKLKKVRWTVAVAQTLQAAVAEAQALPVAELEPLEGVETLMA